MDIPALSMGMSQMNVQQQASLSLMKKAMDTSDQQVDFVAEMVEQPSIQKLEQAAQPHLGASVDFKA
ncbi:hypothetical protein CR203_16800 [Salipaludibacillus neizhouensis]|uniref:Motility protein n=1 Tax=Salipaludibacillus neizhouensis TaxID=885475 RepID=A0A3A9K6T2_9BACI|nr:YjfB family protein [Salipaludibacillus neizhouensis]RKL66212.1 hypothetical protein CR203_16800 [Salipaludibacillus neizhouensis]